MMCLLTGACGRPQTDVHRSVFKPLLYGSTRVPRKQVKARRPVIPQGSLRNSRRSGFNVILHVYTFTLLGPSLPPSRAGCVTRITESGCGRERWWGWGGDGQGGAQVGAGRSGDDVWLQRRGVGEWWRKGARFVLHRTCLDCSVGCVQSAAKIRNGRIRDLGRMMELGDDLRLSEYATTMFVNMV